MVVQFWESDANLPKMAANLNISPDLKRNTFILIKLIQIQLDLRRKRERKKRTFVHILVIKTNYYVTFIHLTAVAFPLFTFMIQP